MTSKFSEMFTQIKKALITNGMSESEINKVETQIQQKMKEIEPPKIAIIGFTGVGKSSTLNALFNSGQKISHVRACTKKATSLIGNMQPYTGSKGIINFYDMPGLGESIIEDEKYYKIYTEILPSSDVIIWTFQAGDRSMTPMQNAILRLMKTIGSDFTNRLMFAINKVDATAPGECEWIEKFNIPSQEQKENIKENEQYILERVHEVLPKWNGSIVSYSAKRRFHLEQLMNAMICVMPKDRQWVLNNLSDVADYSEFVAPEYLSYINELRAVNFDKKKKGEKK